MCGPLERPSVPPSLPYLQYSIDLKKKKKKSRKLLGLQGTEENIKLYYSLKRDEIKNSAFFHYLNALNGI